MRFSKRIIQRFFKTHCQRCSLLSNIAYNDALEYINTKIALPNVISARARLGFADPLYFHTDFGHIIDHDDDEYLKIEYRNAMITDYGVVLVQKATRTEYIVYKFIIVLDGMQYELQATAGMELNDPSIRTCISLFAILTNKAHQTYVMNNEACLT